MNNVRYRGWNKDDHVVIVEKLEKNLYANKGYVVNIGNKKQLESARNWGMTYDYKENLVTGGKQSVEVKPLEHVYPNKDFKMKIQQAPTHSSRGGKLSFCTYLIEAADGKKFQIGIDTDILFRILQQSTVINGEVQEKMSFVRQGTSLGMAHEGMVEYKYAEEDKQLKKKLNVKKTKKYIPGHKYVTLTLQSIYFGHVYKWADFEVIHKRNGTYGSMVTNACVLKIYDKPKIKHILLEPFYLDREDTKDIENIDELLEVYRSRVKENISNFKSNYRMSGYSMGNGIDIINIRGALVDKTPSRVDGGKVLDMENNQEKIDKFLSEWRGQMVDFARTFRNSDTNVNCDKLFYTAIDKSPFEGMNTKEYNDIYKLVNPSVKFYIQNENGDTIYER